MSKVRECAACYGSGDILWDVCCPQCVGIHTNTCLTTCGACDGDGTVTEPDSRKDAMADAEALYLAAPCLDLSDAILWGKEARSFTDHPEWRRSERSVKKVARLAARAAFRAVPGLR